ITKTANPSGIGAGTLTITATVAGTGTVGPTGSLTWTTSGGFSCTSTLTVGAGSSTATCNVYGPAVGVYTSQAYYSGASDTNYAAATSNQFNMAIGASSGNISSANPYFLIDGSTAGFNAVSGSHNFYVSAPVTLTGLTAIINSNGTTPVFTVGQGQNGFSNLSTPLTCTVTSGTICNAATVNDAISTGTYIDFKAVAPNNTYKAMWIAIFS
ncbi:MAG: hypothetical protein WCF63_08585, partial [Acidimicrobiales bacterium]